MDEYKKPYLILFNAVTDAVEALKRGENTRAAELLIEAQRKAEEEFIAEE